MYNARNYCQTLSFSNKHCYYYYYYYCYCHHYFQTPSLFSNIIIVKQIIVKGSISNVVLINKCRLVFNIRSIKFIHRQSPNARTHAHGIRYTPGLHNTGRSNDFLHYQRWYFPGSRSEKTEILWWRPGVHRIDARPNTSTWSTPTYTNGHEVQLRMWMANTRHSIEHVNTGQFTSLCLSLSLRLSLSLSLPLYINPAPLLLHAHRPWYDDTQHATIIHNNLFGNSHE